MTVSCLLSFSIHRTQGQRTARCCLLLPFNSISVTEHANLCDHLRWKTRPTYLQKEETFLKSFLNWMQGRLDWICKVCTLVKYFIRTVAAPSASYYNVLWQYQQSKLSIPQTQEILYFSANSFHPTAPLSPGPPRIFGRIAELDRSGGKRTSLPLARLKYTKYGKRGHSSIRPGGHYHGQSTNKSLSVHMRTSLLKFSKICRPDICSLLPIDVFGTFDGLQRSTTSHSFTSHRPFWRP